MSTIVTQTELEQALSKSRDQIRRLISKGMPVFTVGSKGKPYEFDLEDCLEWYQDLETTEEAEARLRYLEEDAATEKDADLKQAKLRKLTIEADRLEIRLQEDRKQVVKIEDIATTYEEQIANLRALLLLIPQRMINHIGTENAEVLKDYITEVLEELSSEEAIDRVVEGKKQSD